MLHYTIMPVPAAHLWRICLSFYRQDNKPLQIKLPNWVPGSYLIRDFSRHIISIDVLSDGRPAVLEQISKNEWTAEGRGQEWQIHYTVYAFDLSVRGSFLSTERGFFDGACLLLNIVGLENQPHQIAFEGLPEGWQIATSMPGAGKHIFQTASYAALIDHPFELGTFETLHFEAGSIPHRIVLSGRYRDFDRPRLLENIQRICTAQQNMFPSPAPFQEYLFLLHVGDDIYGGLEHISSTALLAGRNSLPARNMIEPNDAYIQLLGLFSHEYFHAWNVKSIKPAAFLPYRLDSESYTEQLWAFEGITSYYDDLFLVRSGVIAPEAYLKLLAQTITRVQQGKGRLKQTLAQSSFTAWNKFYKPDENSPNAIVSYYQKGALAALCLDLQIRSKSAGKHSLDTVMQTLYRNWCENGKGIKERQWQVYCQEITGLDLGSFFQTALYSTGNLPLQNSLETAGVKLQWQAAPRSRGGGLGAGAETALPAGDLGARFKQNAHGITLTHVFNGGSAEQAALCPKDTIIAVNGFACTAFEQQWPQFEIGETLHIHYFRHGVLHETDLTVQAAEADTAVLEITDRYLLKQWLGV
ncbi:M61 family metallopeptidase [Neisseria sp. WF04]|uniref:M61 family metallopeptidase n=1 Tax=unclassified Neisseria TaxID=2623750 RepID=UPI001071FA54|nr:M61 family metallopeptidase [Neisseria sp. WF04]MBF0803205.1 M61 family metallopeptidase [Neisseria sp. 19428wB4_WF04]TFU44192.1 M61 family peptidase [Neisseria sp. WF04]